MVAFTYLVLVKPFDDSLLQNLEVFNEVTSMTLLYLSFAWIPDLLDSEDAKNNVGWIFNAFMGVNISVHLYFMFRNAFRDAKARCRKRKSKKA